MLLHRSFGIGIRWVLIGINEVPGGKWFCNIHYFSLNIQGSVEKMRCVIWNVLRRKEVIDGESYHMWDSESKCWSNTHLPIILSIFFFPFQNYIRYSHYWSLLKKIFSDYIHLVGVLSRKQNFLHQVSRTHLAFVKYRSSLFLAPSTFKLKEKAVRDYKPSS